MEVQTTAPAHSRLARFLWLMVAVCAHFFAALNGVLSRYLQTKASPPSPGARLAVLINLVALATLLCCHAAPLLVLSLLQRCRRRQAGRAQSCAPSSTDVSTKASRAGASGAPSCGSSKGSIELSTTAAQTAGQAAAPPAEAAAASSPACRAAIGAAAQACPTTAHGPNLVQALADEEAQAGQLQDSPGQGKQGAVLQPQQSTWRPGVPMQRGLSARLEVLTRHHPRLHRALALAALVLSSTGVMVGLIIAPGFVDPSIVQLVQMHQVLMICFIQAILLRHRLPWQLWPAAATSVGGAAMVIVPNLGQSVAGSLGTTRGWIGFGISVATVASGAVSLILMQATRHMGLTVSKLQYWCVAASLPVLAAVSLAIDGTDWTAQLGGWSASDWVVLAVTGSVIYIGLSYALQYAVWNLGAPTVSLMAGLRLISAIAQSKLILGTTAVQTPLQIAGIVLTISAVTAFMWWQWSQAQRQQKEASLPPAAPA